MTKFIAYRLLFSVFVVFGASLLSFSLLTLAPGNAAEAILKAQRTDDPRIEEIQLFMEKHELEAPWLIRLTQWFRLLGNGNLGISLRTGQPVASEFWSRFPATLELAIASTLVAILIAYPIGVLSAVKRNTLFDHGSRFVALWGVSMPNFWLSLLLIWFFGVYLGWLPTYGYGGFKNLILPAVTLGTSMTAILMRVQRASMLEVLGKNYIRTAKAKGLSGFTIIGKHALKNTLIPMITILGMQFAHLLSGVVIVEQIFAWPGIGHFLVDSIHAKDYPVIQGFVLLIAFIFVFINFMVDVCYAFIDPRVRYESKA